MALRDGTCLCVKGLPDNCLVADLDGLFRPHGRVANVHLPVEPVSKGHRGFAFVTMSSPRAAQACISALHGSEFGGRYLVVEMSHRSRPHSKTSRVNNGTDCISHQGDGRQNGRHRHSSPGAGIAPRDDGAAHGTMERLSISPPPSRNGRSRRGGGASGGYRTGRQRYCDDEDFEPGPGMGRRGGRDAAESHRAAQALQSPACQGRSSRTQLAADAAVAEPLSEPASASSSRAAKKGSTQSRNYAHLHGHGHGHGRGAPKSHRQFRTSENGPENCCAVAEPLCEPAAAAPSMTTCPAVLPLMRHRQSEPLVEPVTEPGGEPLIEEDPAGSPVPSPTRGVEASNYAVEKRSVRPGDVLDQVPPRPPQSPRSRISQLENANIQSVAKQTVDELLLNFQQHGFSDPHAAAQDCLKVSLDILGSAGDGKGRGSGQHRYPHGHFHHHNGGAYNMGSPCYEEAAAAPQSPVVIVGPEDFKNPSSFLRMYGDPLANLARSGGGYCQPESRQNGNWRCEQCGNVNFPRRSRCHKCQLLRGPSGDSIVLQYCLKVYDAILMGKSACKDCD